MADDTADALKRQQAVERVRKWRAENPEKVAENARRYRLRHPDRYREGKRRRAARRAKREADARLGLPRVAPHSNKMRTVHGLNWEAVFWGFWDAQGGCCYLCGDPLTCDTPQSVAIDHDHSCCPRRKTCDACRRGLACGRCNKLVGFANEDPERLHRIADALATANALVAERRRILPVQEAMF